VLSTHSSPGGRYVIPTPFPPSPLFRATTKDFSPTSCRWSTGGQLWFGSDPSLICRSARPVPTLIRNFKLLAFRVKDQTKHLPLVPFFDFDSPVSVIIPRQAHKQGRATGYRIVAALDMLAKLQAREDELPSIVLCGKFISYNYAYPTYLLHHQPAGQSAT